MNKYLKLLVVCLLIDQNNVFAKENVIIPTDEINNFAKVYAITKNYYVESVNDSKLMKSAIKGMLTNLDPHSMYLDKDTYKQLSEMTNGSFAGLGIELSRDKADSGITVIAPIEGTPAFLAGIKSGDIITKINNQPVSSLSLDEAISKMRGQEGTAVNLLIARKNELKPIQFTIKRAIIKVYSIKYNYFDNNYAYIKINDFQQDTVTNLVRVLNIIHKAKPNLKGIVLDLRDNPGGILQSAVGVSGTLLPDNKLIVSTKGRFVDANQDYYNRSEDYNVNDNTPNLNKLPLIYKSIPIVVLINQGTASASEIVAGALQDYNRAKIIGTKSFGKGSVQTVIPLSSDTAMKLTTALYYTPKGRSIQAEGIKPDIIVKSEYSDIIDSWDISEASYNNHLANPNIKDGSKFSKDHDTIVIEPVTKITTKAQVIKRNKDFINNRPKVVNQDIINLDLKNDFQLQWALNILEGKPLPNSKSIN
jgi:carboxyl-terminal processing protease